MLPTEYEIRRYTADEDRLIAELIARKIIHNEWVCEFGRTHIASVSARCFRCRCGRHDRSRSLFYGSMFDGTKLGPGDVLLLVYEWLSDCTIAATARRTGRALSTVSRFYAHFRRTVCEELTVAPVKLGGLGVTVEIDEMLLRKNRTTGEDLWVLGAVERTEHQRVHLAVLASKSVDDIVAALAHSILPGSLLVTDFLPSYTAVAVQLRCPLIRVNKSRSLVDPATRMHTNTIEGLWALLRKFIKVRQHIALQSVLGEFSWRRANREDAFEQFLQALSKVEWLFDE